MHLFVHSGKLARGGGGGGGGWQQVKSWVQLNIGAVSTQKNVVVGNSKMC